MAFPVFIKWGVPCPDNESAVWFLIPVTDPATEKPVPFPARISMQIMALLIGKNLANPDFDMVFTE